MEEGGRLFWAFSNVQCKREQEDFSWLPSKNHVENKREWG